MADDANEKKHDDKKVMSLRTFADDVKRAKAAMGSASTDTEPAATEKEPPAEETKEPKKAAPAPPPKPEPEPKEAPQQKEVAEDNDGVEFEEPFEAPPFHAIRASSPDDTNFTDEESIEVADKESLQKETVRKTTPPARPQVASEGIQFDTENIPEHKPSVHSGADGVFDAEEALEGSGDGTIVLDRKRKRFRLLPAIATSIKNWFGAKKDAFEEARKPKHVVEKADRRKDVIAAAGRESKQAPRDDFASVSDRLRDVERVTTTDELQIKDEEVARPSWRHIAEGEEEPADRPPPQPTERPDEEAEEAESSPSTPEPETAATPEAPPEQEPARAQQQPEPPAEEPAPTSAPPPPRQPEPPSDEQPAPTEPRRSPQSAGFAEYREKYGEEYNPREDTFGESLPPAEETASPEEVEKPRLPRQEVPDYRLDRVGQPRREARPQGTPYLTMIAVIVAAVILGVGGTIWWFTRDAATETAQPTPSEPALVESQANLEVPLGNDRGAFYSNLRGAISRNAGGVVTFSPSVSEARASTESIFTVLAWNAPGSMTRAVNRITFGGLNGEVPFIVMHFASFDTVFGGMLSWESTMSSDLAPLFGEPTNTSSIDSRVNNRDIRVLVGPDGADDIVYGFPDKNTLLITTNRNAYSTIAPKVQ